MAGHNKWSKVKRLKAVTDKRRGAMFSKILKEIMVAAKMGSDPSGNARLRKAISDAKAQSVPKDNIERAVKKGAGEMGDGVQLEELTYEAFGPGGVAFMIECVTDNRLRTQPEIKKIFERGGGAMAEMGAVAWSFEKKGIILIDRSHVAEEMLMNLALDAGADDLNPSGEGYEITTSPPNFENVRSVIEKSGIAMELAEVTYVPTSRVSATEEISDKIERLNEILEEHDDVQRVVHNAESE